MQHGFAAHKVQEERAALRVRAAQRVQDACRCEGLHSGCRPQKRNPASHLAQEGRAALRVRAAQRVQRALGHVHRRLAGNARAAEEVAALSRPQTLRARHLLQAHAARPHALRTAPLDLAAAHVQVTAAAAMSRSNEHALRARHRLQARAARPHTLRPGLSPYIPNSLIPHALRKALFPLHQLACRPDLQCPAAKSCI